MFDGNGTEDKVSLKRIILGKEADYLANKVPLEEGANTRYVVISKNSFNVVDCIKNDEICYETSNRTYSRDEVQTMLRRDRLI